ncbi:diacylglycerol kinase family protein [Peptococcaceae bacterium 1198_IL3148]
MWSRFSRSLGWAFKGIIWALKTERHMQFHLLATVAAILVAYWLKISVTQWLFIIFAIALVWMAELINTAIEAVVDLCTQDHHPLAKVAKDVAAGAVLIAAVNSLVVAALVLLPKLLSQL